MPGFPHEASCPNFELWLNHRHSYPVHARTGLIHRVIKSKTKFEQRPW